MQTPSSPVILLLGPTASGKTDLALALAAAFPLDVVSVDSAMVYRGMDIGTAKPEPAILGRVPHALIDIRDPHASYSAAAFVHDAREAIARSHARGRVPLLVGGTMLYFRALLDGLDDLPGADPAIRASIAEEAAQSGWPALHARLARLDPALAARLAPHDAQRIGRALEIIQITGAPASSRLSGARSAPPWRMLGIALWPQDRGALHARIAQRFQAMLDAGLVDELARLRGLYPLDPGLPAMRAVGYRQAWAYLDGQIDRATLVEQGIAATRQLAKRQFTWMRGWREPLIQIDPLSANPAQAGVEAVRAFLGG